MGCPYAWVWQRRRLLHVRAPVSSCVRQACTDESSGNIDMTAVFPFLGSTELEVLAVVGSFLLLLTHAITAFCTKERVVVSSKCVRSPPAVFGSSADLYPEDDPTRVYRVRSFVYTILFSFELRYASVQNRHPHAQPRHIIA